MVKNPPNSKGDLRRVQSLGQEDFLVKGMDRNPTPVKFHGQKSLVGYSP